MKGITKQFSQQTNALKRMQQLDVEEQWCRLYDNQLSLSEAFSVSYRDEKNIEDQSNMLQLKSIMIQFQKHQQKGKNIEQQSNKLWKITKNALNQKLIYKKTIVKLKQILQQTVITIQNQLSRICKDFTYYTDISEDNDIKQAQNMCKFIQHSIHKITELSQSFSSLQNTISLLKVKNSILTKDYQKLVHHLQDRKVYSQKLKLKMNEFKQKWQKSEERNIINQKTLQNIKIEFNKALKQKNQISTKLQEIKQQLTKKQTQNQKIFEYWKAFQDNSDIKYKNRNQFILIIRSLALKIQKHEKQCLHQNNIILGAPLNQFLNNFVTLRRRQSPQS